MTVQLIFDRGKDCYTIRVHQPKDTNLPTWFVNHVQACRRLAATAGEWQVLRDFLENLAVHVFAMTRVQAAQTLGHLQDRMDSNGNLKLG